MSGFHQAGFTKTLGNCVTLEHSGGFLIERGIASTDHHDLISPYPMFACQDFSAIRKDISSHRLRRSQAISMTIRTDSLCEQDVLATEMLWDWFRPFKTHYMTNLKTPWRETAGRNAIRYEKRAREFFDYSEMKDPKAYASDLIRLNTVILKRTQGRMNKGISEAVLKAQLGLDGVRLFGAADQNGIKGLAVFMTVKKRAYAYLLGATNEARDRHVIYGLYGYALDTFQDSFEVVDFGGAPGLSDDPNHAVVQFKKLWTNQTAKSFICGKIFRPDTYKTLAQERPNGQPNFFPAYSVS